MAVFFEDDSEFWTELLAIGLGEDFKVIVLVIAGVFNFAFLDDAYV